MIISNVIIHFLYGLHEEDLKAQQPHLNKIDVENGLGRKFPSWLHQYIGFYYLIYL